MTKAIIKPDLWLDLLDVAQIRSGATSAARVVVRAVGHGGRATRLSVPRERVVVLPLLLPWAWLLRSSLYGADRLQGALDMATTWRCIR